MPVVLPGTESELRHIFRDAEGHIPDTPENRTLLLRVANDPAAFLGQDRYANDWSALVQQDGTHVWTQARNGKMINGGINITPRTLGGETGLSRP